VVYRQGTASIDASIFPFVLGPRSVVCFVSRVDDSGTAVLSTAHGHMFIGSNSEPARSVYRSLRFFGEDVDDMFRLISVHQFGF